jgi:predicted ArsR family transcriptional regulator
MDMQTQPPELTQAILDALVAPTDVSTLAQTLNISAHEAVRMLIDLEKSGKVRRLSQLNPPLFMSRIQNHALLSNRPKKQGRPKSESENIILNHLETHGPSSVTGISQATGIPRGTIKHILERLEARWQVVPSARGRRVRGRTLIWQLPGTKRDTEIAHNLAVIKTRPRPAWADQNLIPAIAMVDGTRRVVWLSPTEAYRIAEEIKS